MNRHRRPIKGRTHRLPLLEKIAIEINRAGAAIYEARELLIELRERESSLAQAGEENQ